MIFSDLRKLFAFINKNVLIIFVILFMLYSTILVVFSIPGFPKNLSTGKIMPYLADKPIGEDGFYMLTVAWNFAKGDGLTYNYDVPTTGIQPLSTIVFGFIAKLTQLIRGDKWLFIRLIFFFGSLTHVLFAFLVGSIATFLVSENYSSSIRRITIVIALFDFWLYRMFTYGLETGIYLLLIACCILLSLHRKTIKNLCFLGVVVGLTGLARIDFGVAFFIYLGISIIQKRLSIAESLLVGFMAVAVVSPWFIYLYRQTGSFMPSSGTAEAGMITFINMKDRISAVFVGISEILLPFIYTGKHFSLGLTSFLIFCSILSISFFQKSLAFQYISRDRIPVYIRWVISISIFIIIYPVFFWSTHFYDRYFAPVSVVVLPILGITLSSIYQNFRHKNLEFVGYFTPIIFFVFALMSLHTGRIGNTHVITAGYLKNQGYTTEKVGAFQSGVIGYFFNNVINLDGKVNSKALQFSTQKKLGQYVDHEQIQIIVDWPGYIERNFDKQYLDNNWLPCKPNIPLDISICLKRK